MIPTKQAREITRTLERMAAEQAMRTPPPLFPPGSGGVSSRARMAIRVTQWVIVWTAMGSAYLFTRPSSEIRVTMSGDPGPLIYRSAADIARFRAFGYYEGFGVPFPPCQCARCRTPL